MTAFIVDTFGCKEVVFVTVTAADHCFFFYITFEKHIVNAYLQSTSLHFYSQIMFLNKSSILLSYLHIEP